MRLALISDIHGNHLALEAVLADIERAGVDQMVCLGDVALVGPQPRQVVERLMALECPVVMGNTDEELLRGDERAAWCRTQLSGEHLAYIESFRPVVEIPLEGGNRLLCFHGSPRSNVEQIHAITPVAELDEMLDGNRAAVLAGGHTHVQLLRRHRDRVLVNPGSVGLPFDQNPWTGEVPQEQVRLAPWAEYAILTSRGAELSVELRRVPLDVAAMKAAALATDWPMAEAWAGQWRT
jgi:putative phosphoesterase